MPAAAVSSVSGLLPTAQQVGGTLEVAMIGVVSGNDLTRAMAYQLVILVLAALLADRREAAPVLIDPGTSMACATTREI